MGILLIFGIHTQKVHAAESSIENARNGIVEIYSGFVSPEGKFCQMQHGSGFLISNEDGATYIITSRQIAENSIDAIKKYCKSKNISTENTQFANTIKVVVKGDVAVNAEILVKSEEENYCILSTENVVSEKLAIKLGDSSKLAEDAKVYALGFPKETKDIEFLSKDVEMHDGKIKNKPLTEGTITKIEHTIDLHEGCTGGPLLDEDGYIVGINVGEKETSLAINEVAEVLDNFSIYYGSRDKDEKIAKLQGLYTECLEIEEADTYKADSIEALTAALEKVKPVVENAKPLSEDLDSAIAILTEAKAQLIPKMEKIMVAIYILAVLILLLAVWLMLLLILNHKDMRKRRIVKSPIHTITMNKEEQEILQKTEKRQKTEIKQSQIQRKGQALELLREKNGQHMYIKNGSFYIGSNPQAVNYCITDNKAISRRHAMIAYDGAKYYFSDLKSSNGSKVNGKVVQPGEKICLHTGDEILLADEKFMVL